MGFGRPRRDSAGASMERALRALSPRGSVRALTNKSTTPKAASTTSAKLKPSFEMKSSSAAAAAAPDDHLQGTETKDGEEEAVKVAIRIRPLANHNDPQVVGRAWKASREKNSIAEISTQKRSTRYQSATNEAEYEFDKVFGEDSNTNEIYNELVGDIVESVANGVNGTVFTYGQTSSGKTFTMRGDDSKSDSSIGIIQLAAKEIFDTIQQEKSNNPNCECNVRVSYTEIYNEELRDLLNDSKRKTSTSLTIREDKRGSITVEGRKEVAVSSLEELMEVFRIGEANKSVGCTKMNDRSSRSHVIFQVTLIKKTTLDTDEDKENDNGRSDGIVVSTTSTLNLVDLAGSESVRHTGAIGMQKKEGGMINQSLLTLSKVLMSLGKSNPGHINYRDSKLTRILKPSLSGNARMAVICCISPSDKYREETKSTLQFATRAKLVKSNATSNEMIEDESDVVAKLRLENARAKKEIREKEQQLMEMAARLGDNPTTEMVGSSSLLELQSQLTNANGLVASLERQVDELSSQKNDALDWIEELFSKVELKENKIKEIVEERNQATLKSDDLENRLSDTLVRLEEVTVRNEKLQVDNDEAAKVIHSMKGEIESSKGKAASENQTAETIEELHSELARAREDYDISQHTLRQVRADNEELRKDAESQISELMCEIEVLKSHQSATDRDNDNITRENEQLTSQVSDLEDTLRLVRANNEELRNDSEEEINELMVEIKRLKSQLNADTIDSDEMMRKNEQLSVLEDTLRQVRADNEELRNDAESQINELTNQLHGLRDAVEKNADEKRAMEQRFDEMEKEMARCEQELCNVKSTSEPASDEGPSECAQLYEKISSLERDNEELANQLDDIEDVSNKHAEEKKTMLAQIEQYEQDLSICEEELSEAKAALKSRSLESAAHCVNSKMIEEKERAIDELRQELTKSVSSNDYLAEEVKRLQQSNEKLENQRRRMNAEMDECQRNVKALTSKLLGTQRLLDEAKQRGSNTEQLESKKAELAERFSAANDNVEKLKVQLEQAGEKLMRSQEENISLKERESELRGSVSRIRELVESMKRRNAELEEENDSLRGRSDAVEEDIRAALEERDDAYARKDEISSERDAAIEEHENVKMKLDTLAAELEADCETMRSKVEIVTSENKRLEDRIAILEAGKTSFEYKSDRILERDNALAGQHERLVSEALKQAKKMSDLKNEVKELSLVVKRLELEKQHFIAERATLRETIKTMRTRLRSSKNEPSPRASFVGPTNNKSDNKAKTTFFRSRQ